MAQRKTEIESAHPRHHQSRARRFESQDSLKVLRSRFDSGGDVSANELLGLSSATVREFSGMNSQELLEIFHFLLTFRVRGMTDAENRSFSQNIEEIANCLSPKISRNGDTVNNPFRGWHTSTGRQLRNTIYREALRVGQVEAANVFA